jgi:cytochrome c oxidase assembly protein Cox11
VVTVRFDSNVAPDPPWRFDPQEREVKVHLGEQRLVFFTAENTSGQTIVGHDIQCDAGDDWHLLQ